MLLASLRGCEASPQRRRGRQSRLPLAPQPGAPFLLRFGRFLSSEASSLSLSTCDCQHPAWDSWIPGLWRGRRAAACPSAACTANNQVGTVSGRTGTEKETLPGLLPAWSSEDKPMPTRPCTTSSYQQGIPLGRSRGHSQRGWGQQPWGSASCVRRGQPRELCTGVMSRYRWPERSILWAMPSGRKLGSRNTQLPSRKNFTRCLLWSTQSFPSTQFKEQLHMAGHRACVEPHGTSSACAPYTVPAE